MTNSSKTLMWSLAVMIAGFVIGLPYPAQALATLFRNLDFESAIIGTPTFNEVLASQSLPYWTNNNWHSGYLLYDDLALDSVCVSIHDGRHIPQWYDFNPLQGSYSLMLQTSSQWASPPYAKAWISQTGDIPVYAQSILFVSDWNCPIVSLDGVTIPTSVHLQGTVTNGGHGPVTTYIGDIRAFSGHQNVELRFESAGWSTLDAIQFSSILVPEPSAFALLVGAILGGIAYVLRRARGSDAD
jgi:hypothetical protein